MTRPLVSLFFKEAGPLFADAGYTPEQVTKLRGTIGDGTILQAILAAVVQYGPQIIQIVLALLPLFAAKEPPATPPTA